VTVRIEVPSGGRWFEGHLPGRPIFPGVAQLLFMVNALRSARAGVGPLVAIEHARLRQLVSPGEALDLTYKVGESGLIRVILARAGAIVTQAALVFGALALPPAASESVVVSGTDVDAPPLDALLPHRATMRLLTGVVAERSDGLICEACIPAACALVSGTTAPALAAVEAAAQAAAAWEALRRARTGGAPSPRIGYVVALRDVAFFTEIIAAERPFLAAVRLVSAALPLTHYATEVACEGVAIMRGTIATYLAELPMS
jgi:predicted hotdog family 3-hydroxylacyl-ACP dehydratase